MAEAYQKDFIRDAKKLLEILGEHPAQDSSEEQKKEHRRALHSLKSGAAFLEWQDIEQEVHTMEELLENPEESSWARCAASLSGLIAERAAQIQPEKSEPSREKKVGIIRFNEYEKNILFEARKRGERFYRLTCFINSAESMLYPRAYLLASRIETSFTLIKSDPPLEDETADFSRVVFWLTTELLENDIYRSAQVDLVEAEELVPLNFAEVLEEGSVYRLSQEEHFHVSSPLISVERSQLQVLEMLVEELSWYLEKTPDSSEFLLAEELEGTLNSLCSHVIGPLITELEQYSHTIAERQNLEVSFQGEGDSGLQLGVLESLRTILHQLIQNSLRHGIESPQSRVEAGKPSKGRLRFVVRQEGDTIQFSYSDDGRGVDENMVLNQDNREEAVSEAYLLDVLCSAGFTTLNKVDLDGGRGTGLELVRHIVESELGGILSLENTFGQGLTFRWQIPALDVRRPYLIFMALGRTWAIPVSLVRRLEVLDPSRVNATGQAYSLGGGMVSLVTPEGPLSPGSAGPYVLEIRHRGRRAALSVDDLISEELWAREDLKRIDPPTRWARSLARADKEIPILSSAIVYAGGETSSLS